MAQAKPGDRVKVHITGRTTDGAVVETTEGRSPLLVEVGSRRLIPGLRKALTGMAEGQEKTVLVPPEEAYGQRKPGSFYEVSLDMLPKGAGEGDKLHARTGEKVVEVWVKEVGKDRAILDENHPLAGETLEYDLKVVSVESQG